MQNKYLEMMEATQRVISRANDISATAEKVTNMMGVHKDDLAQMGEVITGRYDAIVEMLQKDKVGMLDRIATLTKELDEAIAALQGKVAEAPAANPAPTEAEILAANIAGGGNAET